MRWGQAAPGLRHPYPQRLTNTNRTSSNARPLFYPTARTTSARLHRNLQKNPCGDFAEGSFRVSGNSKEASATRAAPNAAAPRGDRGENKMIFPPAALRARVDDPSTRESGPLPQLPAANKKTDEPQTRPFLFHFFNSRVKANAEPSSTSSSRIRCPCISKMR